MTVTRFIEAPKVPSALDGKIMHTSENVQIIHLCLSPGETIAPHINQVDVVACLIEGQVTCHLNDQPNNLDKFDVIEIKAGSSRGFTNKAEGDSRLLMIKKLK